MDHDFNKVIDRSKTNATKWDDTREVFGKEVFPMWIADMDLEAPRAVIEALKRRCAHGVFGYSSHSPRYFEIASDFGYRHFGYRMDEGTLHASLGVVPTLSLLICELTQKHDAIIIQSPVYYPFAQVVLNNKRRLIQSPLINDGGYYTMDIEDFERRVIAEEVRLFILCSPHNPVGRVWRREELEAIGAVCLRHGVRIISDEIWRDLVMDGASHIPLASLGTELEQNTITCFSPSKSFNLAGMQASFVALPRRSEYMAFDSALDRLDIKGINPFSLVAYEAAYKHCDDYLLALCAHIEGNIDFALSYIDANIPVIRCKKPEATYLLWLDCRGLGLDDDALMGLLVEGGLGLDLGAWFGKEGSGYMRMNVACPRAYLKEGLERLKKALTGR